MTIDDSGWRDLDERLAALSLSPEERDTLLRHLTERLVGHFGTDAIECHGGKDEPRRHEMREVAAAALAHIGPVLDALPPDALRALIDTGAVGTSHPPPWDDEWRNAPRTASWRS